MVTTWVLVPAYQPDHRLVELLGALRRELPGAGLAVVDDGSGERYQRVFDAAARLGASVLHHPRNRGKAAALRTGMAWIAELTRGRDDVVVVCADCDGQHRPGDVAAVADEVARRLADGERDVLVLGSRAFTGRVPLRSRIGNRAMTGLVALATGRRIGDTQTGLRGFGACSVPWLLRVPGERFAYELRVLLEAAGRGGPVVEVPIATVYLDHNASSHFRPLVDSVRVLAPLLLFAASSLLAAAVDLAGVLLLEAATGSLVLAVVGARLASASVNFALNRRAVFPGAARGRAALRGQVLRYVGLAVVLLAAGYVGIRALEHIGLPLVVAKPATDLALWVASFVVQRRVVFAPGRRGASGVEPRPAESAGTSAGAALVAEGVPAQRPASSSPRVS